MSWGLPFTSIATNLGVSMDYIILIIAVFGSLIFYAKDFKIGLIMTFLFSGLSFMLSYAVGGNWMPSAVVFFMSLAAMSLSLYAVSKAQAQGGLV